MRLLCTAAVMVLALGYARAAPFERADEWEFLSEPAYGVATAGLTHSPPEGVNSTLDPDGARVRFARFAIASATGEPRSLAAALVEPTGAEPRLALDANLDGILTADEVLAPVADRALVPPGFAKGDEPVWLAELRDTLGATIALRVSGFGATLSCAVRGYARGTLPAGGRDVPVALVDVAGDGVLDRARDTVLLDLDGDGACTAPDERRQLWRWMDVPGGAFRLTTGVSTAQAAWEPAPTGACPLTVGLGEVEGAVQSFSASLAREGSGAVAVSDAGAPVEVPFGEYCLSSLDLTVAAEDGTEWAYSFIPDQDAPFELAGANGLTLTPFADLTVVPEVEGAVEPGSEVTLGAEVRGSLGLLMLYCGRAASRGATREDIAPDLEVRAPDGSVLLSGSLSYG